MRIVSRCLLALGLLLQLGCGGTAAVEAEPKPAIAAAAGEANVAPDVNQEYKNPELDVELWAGRFTGESREVYSARRAVLAALQLKAGDRIADIGAGTGLYVKLFAETVGASGQVYAVDIAQPFLDFISKNAAADGLNNVAVVLGEDRTSNLPDDAVDVVFHSDTYHHFEYPLTMNRDLARALVTDGRLFVLDFERIPGVSREWTLSHVRAGKETVIAEVEESGFELVAELEVPGLEDNYLLEFRKRSS